ncbi:MDR family oxidoreductase [Nesterenkonia sandarakina]|uniref:Acrylyl-CoA reductase (NADPH) n=1 Tax=Nesterenkonia sandarakina TaxID=272918 RepID=A0A7Z0E846_9MICC|nr:MDR family oxidoreductase [Nesterenkonia sandarakina]NYJ16826.1 acrylyl-CoA reductase (NADPH) [Nesterenkonia sandarakina]
MTFRAALIEQRLDGGRIQDHQADLQDLPEEFLDGAGGDAPVDIDVHYSGINYKDGLALAGKPGVARTSPLIPGIDLVGEVTASADPQFRPGDAVVLTGGGIGEAAHGGLAQRARVSAKYLVKLPDGLSERRAAAIGTAGFTAMLAVLALEHGGVRPEAGEVVVSGAAGGVGSVAIAVLNTLGYSVTAVTGRAQEQGEYLRSLGAANLLERSELAETGPALQKRRWAGGIDSAGSATLANILSQTDDGGTVASCGLAQGHDLPTTVMPFILRGVTLAGINSVTASPELRAWAWSRLARDLPMELLDEMTQEITLDQVFDQAEQILAGQVRGRTVVNLAG